jgi:hypothetical protein
MADSPIKNEGDFAQRHLRRTRYILQRLLHYFVLLPVALLGRSIFALLIVLLPLAVIYTVIDTPKDRAYRNLHPLANSDCQDGLQHPWQVLADVNRQKAAAGETDEDGWIDPSNSELDAVEKEARWETRFRCSLQYHEIPIVGAAASDVAEPLRYHLAFLEFRESGEPYSLVQEDESPLSAKEVKALQGSSQRVPVTQLDVLRNHLSTGSHYVIVFAHGWRHDASLGDQNVADLRHYAAHVSRFLVERCADERRRNAPPEHCGMDVTAVYIGWRGARVDEKKLRRYLGPIGGALAQVTYWATLFDRKPVAEQVAPVAISALRSIERDLSKVSPSGGLKKIPENNKMIVIGHSLGGDLLITGLQEDALKAVRLHKPTELVPPLLGDLVVLINPAAEASKWTSIQKEVWSRTPYKVDRNTPLEDIIGSHKYFHVQQRPVIISVTSSFGFPPGGLQDGDCVAIEARDQSKRIMKRIQTHTGEFEQLGVYDWATHDLFPTFKLDFRPLADLLQRFADRIEGGPPRSSTCDPHKTRWYSQILSYPVRFVSWMVETLPFQNSDKESSHTIGHLDPPRVGAGLYTDGLASQAPFGTTHEMRRIGDSTSPNERSSAEQHNAYAAIPNAKMLCRPANHWLQRARQDKSKPNGTYWDSAALADHIQSDAVENEPAARFHHGFISAAWYPLLVQMIHSGTRV